MRTLDAFRRFALRAPLGAGAATLLGLAIGEPLFGALLPALKAITDAIWPAYVPRLLLAGHGMDAELQLWVTTGREIVVNADLHVPVGTSFGPAEITVGQAMVPVVILLAGLLSWPVHDRRDVLVRLLSAAPLGLLVIVLTVPFELAVLVDLVIVEMLAKHGVQAPGSPASAYLDFLEMGGRWLLPILLAALVIALGRARRRTPPVEEIRYLGG